ncbi:unnamed protein product [Choristocarpus tenellus]
MCVCVWIYVRMSYTHKSPSHSCPYSTTTIIMLLITPSPLIPPLPSHHPTHSSSLRQFLKSPMYPSLVSVILDAVPSPRVLPPSASSSSPELLQTTPKHIIQPPVLPPTSSAEFLTLALACAGLHVQAAALVYELAGAHSGLRTLKGGLALLSRHLRGQGVVQGVGDDVEPWFSPSMEGLRGWAVQVLETDLTAFET